ncbi:hypothetical protein ACWATR_08130 [Nostoc sp. UIC 10890]
MEIVSAIAFQRRTRFLEVELSYSATQNQWQFSTKNTAYSKVLSEELKVFLPVPPIFPRMSTSTFGEYA